MAEGKAFVFQFLWNNVLSPIASFVSDILFPVFSSVFESIGDIIGSVKRIFQGLIDFVAGVFTGDWSRAWEGIKEIFGGIWEGFEAIVKSPINTIIGFANGLISGIADMVNYIAKMLNGLSVDVPSWVPKFGGKKLGFNLPTWTPGKIPYLATGTVVPPNREFMAVLGDNKREPEIVSPVSTMKQANKEAMQEVLSELGLTGGEIGNNQPIIVKLIADGKQLTELVIKNGKVRQMSTGKNPFLLGVT